MKVIYRHKRNQSRLLASWGRKALDFKEIGSKEKLAEALAGLRGQPAIYHVVSRVVDRRMVLGSEEKEVFVRYMREYEEFCMVRVLAFCVMTNHFHILVEIPRPPEDRGKSWSDEEFLRHVSCRYKGDQYMEIAAELNELREGGFHADAEAYRDKFFARMWNLAAFMHDLKMHPLVQPELSENHGTSGGLQVPSSSQCQGGAISYR